MRLLKKQIYLTLKQEARLREAAAQHQVSEAEVIRRALDQYLEAVDSARTDDPLLPLIGSVAVLPGHDSSTIDHDLYGEAE